MNIKDAKIELCNTLQAYHKKDKKGQYLYPLIRQRPILLMGPPGIGKTAIMEQVAAECQVGLVAYTITHHTRQSAIGLPHIERRIYGEEEVTVTEYTMSEIIASVYDCMERTGYQEGILFIDEINCVSETLAPTMLQFLQNKTFGSHKVPEGWMIVAAGNPPQYNKSVREFDIVTLDRVRKIDIEVDLDVWMEYAWEHEIHGAILSYLQIKPENFYLIENTPEGKFFATARGWEDLSSLLMAYEEMDISIGKEVIEQFIQKREVAENFGAYYGLYCKYGTDYGIAEIIAGEAASEKYKEAVSMAQNAGFEERFTVVGLVLSGLQKGFLTYQQMDRCMVALHKNLKNFKEYLEDKASIEVLEEFVENKENSLKVMVEAGLLEQDVLRGEEVAMERMRAYLWELRKEHTYEKKAGFAMIQRLFQDDLKKRREIIEKQGKAINRAFAFLEECFANSQEMILFVTGMTKNRRAMDYITVHGNDAYMAYSRELLYEEEEKKLLEECRRSQMEMTELSK